MDLELQVLVELEQTHCIDCKLWHDVTFHAGAR